MFKPVQTGTIYGWPSKIMALLACVAGVTFPITGTILWLNRLKKNRRKKAAVVAGRPVLVEKDESVRISGLQAGGLNHDGL